MPDQIEKIFQAPAQVLDKTLEGPRQVSTYVSGHNYFKKPQEYWKTLGPGLTTGAADDDPSGIATYSQTGAQYGFQLLWLAPLTFPLMAVIQEMCARIGIVTGRGLAGNIRVNYPRWVLLTCTFLLLGANILNIGADIGAMAKGAQLLFPKSDFSLWLVGFTALSLALQIFTTYEKYAKYLKCLALILLTYIFSALSVKLNIAEVIKYTLIPHLTFTKDQLFLVCGILGTTISPYLFFWQTSQEVEEQILEGKTSIKLRQAETTDKEVKNMRIDVWSGMLLSNIVMFFIIAACAATLFSTHTVINTAADAAEALRPIAGNNAYILFALGIIGTGLLAVPILAGSASYALSECFGWKKYGLYRKLNQAYAFYGVIIVSMLVGLLINFTGLDPIKALIYSAVANGLVAPVILVLIILLSSNKKVMGERINHPIANIFGWVITILMVAAGVASIWSLF